MTRLVLHVPGLAFGQPAIDSSAAWRRLLARAEWRETRSSSASALLSALGFSSQERMPVANLCAAFDLDLPQPDGWLRADPVQIDADPRIAILVAPRPGELSDGAAQLGLDSLRHELPEYEWRRGRVPERWYAHAPDVLLDCAYGPAWISGRSISPFLPQGVAVRPWRTLFNDAQMVLHHDSDATGVNAVWPWGGGALGTPAPRVRHVVGNDVLLAGAARVGQIPWSAEAADFGQLPDGTLVLVGAPWGVADPAAAPLDVARFAREAAPALWAGLASGRLEEINLVGERCAGRVTPRDRWWFWQRRAPVGQGDPHAVESAG